MEINIINQELYMEINYIPLLSGICSLLSGWF